MNKFTSLILAVLIAMLPVSVFADSNPGTTSVEVNYSLTLENTVTISGTALDIPKNATVTVTVLHGGKTFENLSGTGVSDIEALAALSKLSLSEDLNWSFDWKPTSSGEYDIYVSSKFFDKPVKTSCYLAANRSTVIDTIVNGGEEELSTLFSDNENIKAVIIDRTLYENINDTSKIGTILTTLKQDAETEAEILNLLPLSCYLAAIYEDPSFLLMDKAVSELKALNQGFTNEALYSKSPEVVRNKVAVKLSDKTNNKISDLDSLFTEALILSGVKKSTSYVSVLDYLALLSDKTYEINKTAAANAVVGKDYTTAQLLEAIKTAVTPVYIIPSAPSGGGGGGGGGRVSSTVITGEVTPSKTTETETKKELVTFTDVPGTHWAFDAINNLRWKDIVSGNEKGEFLPDNNITRAEIVKMVCELYNISGGSGKYDDVSENHWAHSYIAAASSKNIIKGDGTNFNPDQFITRQDLATIIFRVTGLYGKTYTESALDFGDSNAISDYALEAIGKLSVAGIIKGKTNGCFEPEALTTRAEAATVIYRLLNSTEVE